MRLKYGVISSDDHVIEPSDLWKSLKNENAPKIVKLPDGNERWAIDGEVQNAYSLVPTGALAADRLSEPQHWSDVPKAGYDPQERLKAMDRDHVDGEVLYPTAAGSSGEGIGAIKDLELQKACAMVYNDFLIDVWAKASPRFISQAVLPIASIEAAVEEAKRAVKRGHKGILLPGAPWQIHSSAPHLYLQSWDPLWATIQDLDVPVCFHGGSAPSILYATSPSFSPAVARAFDSVRKTASSASVMNSFIYSGILTRFPRLQAVFAGGGIDNVPFGLEGIEHHWERFNLAETDGMKQNPREQFYRQCYVTTWREKEGLRNRKYIGVDRILWQSEFPLESSTFPDSSTLIEKNFADVPKGDRDKILGLNAAKLYKIALD